MSDTTSRPARSPYVVGLTGGIGSGKSTVARLFAEHGAEVVDADRVARELVAPGSPALKEIATHFGGQILSRDGALDRAALRARIFERPAEKQWLENLLHPRVREEVQRRVAAAESDYVILEVPLLLESGAYDFVDRVLVVDVPEAVQVERVIRRDDTNAGAVRKIIAAQIDRRERLARADDILDNTVPAQELAQEVNKLHEFYQRQGRARRHQTG